MSKSEPLNYMRLDSGVSCKRGGGGLFRMKRKRLVLSISSCRERTSGEGIGKTLLPDAMPSDLLNNNYNTTRSRSTYHSIAPNNLQDRWISSTGPMRKIGFPPSSRECFDICPGWEEVSTTRRMADQPLVLSHSIVTYLWRIIKIEEMVLGRVIAPRLQ